MTTLIQSIARKLGAIENCRKMDNSIWMARHEAAIIEMEASLPSGGGLDAGSHVDLMTSTPETVIIKTKWHAMDDAGGYCGWVPVTVTVKGSLQWGVDVDVEIDEAAIKAINADYEQDDDDEFHGFCAQGLDDYLVESYINALKQNVDKRWILRAGIGRLSRRELYKRARTER